MRSGSVLAWLADINIDLRFGPISSLEQLNHTVLYQWGTHSGLCVQYKHKQAR